MRASGRCTYIGGLWSALWPAPSHLVEDEGGAAADGGALVGRGHAHPGGLEEARERPAPRPAQDVSLERSQGRGNPSRDHDDFRVQQVDERSNADTEGFAGLVDHGTGERVAGARLLEQDRRADAGGIAADPRQDRGLGIAVEPLPRPLRDQAARDVRGKTPRPPTRATRAVEAHGDGSDLPCAVEMTPDAS